MPMHTATTAPLVEDARDSHWYKMQVNLPLNCRLTVPSKHQSLKWMWAQFKSPKWSSLTFPMYARNVHVHYRKRVISFAAVLSRPEAAIAQLCNATWLVWTGLNCTPKQNISNFCQSKCFHSTSTIINGTVPISGIMPNGVCFSKRTLSWSELQHSQVYNWKQAPTQTHCLLLYPKICKWMVKQEVHSGNMLLWSGSQVQHI